jgi:hypothetical protein
MLSTITPSPRGGGEIHKLPPTTLVEQCLAHVGNAPAHKGNVSEIWGRYGQLV